MRRSCWLAVATMGVLSDAQGECPKAVSIYAMQKTGSTFLGLFSRSVALRQQMCKVLQTTKEFVCETVNYVDCPRNELHRKSVHLERAFAPPSRQALLEGTPSARQGWDCGEPELVGPKGHAQWRCKPDGGPQPGVGELRTRCNDQLRHEMFAAANGWLRSTTHTPKYRYNFSLSRLLSSSGFVRGPMRQLYTEVDARAVPWFGGYHNVVIVHTRHPVEMMVSAYFCISDPKVCPVRAKFLGNHVPVNDSLASLDEFVVRGIRRVGSTPYQIMQRSRKITRFMADFRRAGGVSVLDGGRAGGGCQAPSLLHSKYEVMVSDFSGWARTLLAALMSGSPASKVRGMHTTLVQRHQSSFKTDGKHKHGMFTGANIAKLKQSTVQALVQHAELREVLRDLTYDWFGFDRGRTTNHASV